MVEEAIKVACPKYKESVGKDVHVTIDKDAFLAAST
jgi:hypothetical protein